MKLVKVSITKDLETLTKEELLQYIYRLEFAQVINQMLLKKYEERKESGSNKETIKQSYRQ